MATPSTVSSSQTDLPTSLGAMSVQQMLAATSAKSPTPGGGAIAGMTGALAAALAAMVVRYSIGKKNLLAHQPALEASATALDAMRDEFISLGDRDAQAYAALNTLQKLPADDAHRRAAMPEAVQNAIGVPLRTLRLALDLARDCANLAPITNAYLASDLRIAGALAEAAARASLCNVQVNAPLLEDAAKRASLVAQSEAMVREARDLAARLGG
ncbi:MAG: cyclodeaminase/cyclohydrolase family protein [Phycisphaerales bacterium]|nr:cyclodeaminase/cyclohydrolase family protein [Phycisphaerales bacterium]